MSWARFIEERLQKETGDTRIRFDEEIVRPRHNDMEIVIRIGRKKFSARRSVRLGRRAAYLSAFPLLLEQIEDYLTAGPAPQAG